MEIHNNKFEEIIADKCLELEIANRFEIPAPQWSYILTYIGRNYIKPNSDILLKSDNNKHEYDIDKMQYLLDIYIGLCKKYIQTISIQGYVDFISVNRQLIYDIGNRLSATDNDIHKRLMQLNEISLVETAQARRYNPLLTMAQLNKYHGYNGGGTASKVTHIALSDNDIQKRLLELRENNAQLTDTESD